LLASWLRVRKLAKGEAGRLLLASWFRVRNLAKCEAVISELAQG